MEQPKNWDDVDRTAKKARKSASIKKRRSKRHQDRQNLRNWVDDLNSGRKGQYDEYGDED